MNFNYKNIFASLVLSVVVFTGCKDDMLNEITELKTDRAFSATGLSANVVNKVNVRLTWKPVANAVSYTIEVFDNATLAGTPVKTVSNIVDAQLPYTITGLAGNQQHSVRVKAIGRDGAAESKWVSTTFKTDPEQILNAVNLGDITAGSVKVTWPANETVTRLVFTPGNIVYNLTPADITAGSATVSGLTAETLYTVAIFNNTIQRGTTTFTTAVDVSAFTQVHNDSEFATALATSGPVRIALHPGTYTFASDITANKNITIVGTSAVNKPIINRAVFKMAANAGLVLNNVKLDGNQATNTNQLIVYNEALEAAYGAVTILNSEIYNYQKGLIYINVKSLVESITIENNIIRDINVSGASFIDMRAGFAKTLTIKNNTFYNLTTNDSSVRDFIRLDATTNFPTVINNKLDIVNNTIYNFLPSATVIHRFLYVRLTSVGVTINKNIFANVNAFHFKSSTAPTLVAMLLNNYFGSANFYGGTNAAYLYDVAGNGYTTLDPGFTNAAAGNFTISNIDLKTNGVGDPRWRQ